MPNNDAYDIEARMNNYNCRHPDERLKLVLPGEKRKVLYCPNCDYKPYRGPACLFPQAAYTTPRYHPVTTHNCTRLTEQAMVRGIKQRWLELGRQPKMKEVTSPCTGGHISKCFPGGFKAAVQQAAAQLEAET